MNAPITVPHEILPESKDWKIGKMYRTKMVLKQTGANERNANFDIVDATSLEPKDKANQMFLSDGGMYVGR